MTAAELRAARAELDELTSTNCGWFLYQCRTLLRHAIDEWLIDRLASTRCESCGADARVHSDGFALCAGGGRKNPTCGARREVRPDELAELHAAADRKWARVEPAPAEHIGGAELSGRR